MLLFGLAQPKNKNSSAGAAGGGGTVQGSYDRPALRAGSGSAMASGTRPYRLAHGYKTSRTGLCSGWAKIPGSVPYGHIHS